jgi:hypothetical protein
VESKPKKITAVKDVSLTARRPTPRPVVPFLLVVGVRGALLERCRDVAVPFGALIVECEVDSVRDLVRQWRPVALVMTEDLIEFDPHGFRALADSSGARLISLEGPDATEEAIAAALHPALRRIWKK